MNYGSYKGYGSNVFGNKKIIKDTFENVSKDYNGRVQKALRSNLNENMANYQRIAAGQESKERETVKANEYKNSLTLNADMAGKNYADVGTIDMLVSDSSRLVSARGADQGIDGLTLQQEQQEVYSGGGGSYAAGYSGNSKIDSYIRNTVQLGFSV